MNRINLAILCVLLLLVSSVFGANEVINPGFETDETTSSGWPNSYGDWSGDLSSITGTSDGITPYEGQQMLKFKGSLDIGASPTHDGSEVFQLIDISSYSDLVASGQAIAKTSAFFNRIAGDAYTDTKFALEISACTGDLSNFNGNYSFIDTQEVIFFSDSDSQTWEQVTADLLIPANTDYLAINIAAGEDIYNDGTYPEFDGHYADAVSIEIVPEPATIGLFSLGLILLRKKNKFNC
jgi:hypothetical protein